MMAHARCLEANYHAFVTMLVGYSGMDNAALKDDALKLRDAHEGLLRKIISDGIADGSFRPVDIAMTGRAVLSLLSWMAAGSPRRPEEWRADRGRLLRPDRQGAGVGRRP